MLVYLFGILGLYFGWKVVVAIRNIVNGESPRKSQYQSRSSMFDKNKFNRKI